jgi:hypothetical protein
MPHLITVSGGRIPLHRGQQYVLGRDKECDIVLDDGACSRRHARVVAREGSRIQLGASIFLVRLRERPDEVDFAETGTVSLECMSSHGDIDGGDLGSLGLVELLRLVFNAQRSVTLHVALPEEHHACVEIRGGEVHAAEVAGQRGFQALVRLARQTSGIFWLVETDALRVGSRRVCPTAARLRLVHDRDRRT